MSTTPTPPLPADLVAGGRDPVPLVVAAALALGLAVQLALPPAPLPPTSLSAPARPALRPSDAAPAPLALDAAILARPLFSPGRNAGAGGTTASTAAPLLLGVALAGRERLATVQDEAGGLHTVRLGDEVDGWRLVAVGADRASFSHGGALQVLRVGQGSSSTAPPAAATPTIPGAVRP